MAGRKNRRSPNNSSYHTNNSRKSFDYTMNKLYGLMEDQENRKVNIEFYAKIISGNETGDTSFFGINFFNSSFFTEKDPIVYKIRFIDPHGQYNLGLEDPDLIFDNDKKLLMIENHPDAFSEKNSLLPTVGARVLVTDSNNDGIYRIERFLDETEGPLLDAGIMPLPGASDSFKNKTTGFIKDFFGIPKGEWRQGSNVVFRNQEEKNKATEFLNQLVNSTTPYNIPVFVNSAYRDPTSQARVVSNNTVNTRGKNLVVYGDATIAIYLKYSAAAKANPGGPEMKKLIEYEERKLARALKNDPNYQGHGTGYSFDLSIKGLTPSQLATYKSLIEKLGAKVLYETNPPHFHIWLKDWKPQERTIAQKGYDVINNLANSLKETAE
jgi:hypothetical protein